jgi:hypothetical protein
LLAPTAGWITFFEFFVWLLVLVYLVTGLVHKTRAAMTAMLAASGVLLMDTGAASAILSVWPFLARVAAGIDCCSEQTLHDNQSMLLSPLQPTPSC